MLDKKGKVNVSVKRDYSTVLEKDIKKSFGDRRGMEGINLERGLKTSSGNYSEGILYVNPKKFSTNHMNSFEKRKAGLGNRDRGRGPNVGGQKATKKSDKNSRGRTKKKKKKRYTK